MGYLSSLSGEIIHTFPLYKCYNTRENHKTHYSIRNKLFVPFCEMCIIFSCRFSAAHESTKCASIHVPNPPYTFAGRFHSSSRLSKPFTLPTLEINLPRYSPAPLRPVSPIPQEIREKLLPICVLDRTHSTELNQLDGTVSNKFGDMFSSSETQVTKATVHELNATAANNVNTTTGKTTTTTTSDPVSCNLQAVDSGNYNLSNSDWCVWLFHPTGKPR